MELSKAIPQGYKQTEVGVIPEDWSIDSIASTTPQHIKNGIVDGPFGSNLKTIHYKKSGIPIITSGYVTDGYFVADQYLYVDLEKFKQEKRSAVNPGDIVMAKIGARCGASAILPNNHPESILSGNALKITIDQKRHSTFYIWQVLWQLYTSGKLEDIKTVGAQPAVSMANLKLYQIALPPLEEQKAIATALSDVDALLVQLDALIAKKRDLKQAAMQQLLTAQTRLPGFSEEWKMAQLPDVLDFISGKAHEQFIVDFGQFVAVNSKFVSSDGAIRKYSNINRCPAKKGDVLMVMSDLPNGKALAKCYLVEKDNEFAVNQRVCILRPKKGCSKFFYYILNRNKYFLQFDDGVQQTHLLNATILACSLYVPPTVDEQTAIANILSGMDNEITALEARRDKTRALKQGMMQELLTGKTRLI